jgi:hypothetical protein
VVSLLELERFLEADKVSAELQRADANARANGLATSTAPPSPPGIPEVASPR